MPDLFAKCGTNCGRCPSYRENLITDEDRRRCSEGWHKYHGFRYSPAKLLLCDGCQAPDDQNPVRYLNCLIRRCAVHNGVETCAHCSDYPCEELVGRMLGEAWVEGLASRLGAPIPEKDYLAFVEPYLGIRHLNAIRASLGPEDIVEMTSISTKTRTADFPAGLFYSEEEATAFESLYHLLAAVGAVTGDFSYARHELRKRRRQSLLKLLWAFGLFGELEEDGDPHLVIDSQTYLAQKIHSDHTRVKAFCEALDEHGAHCEIVPLMETGWTTPTGALRRSGWLMKMSFDDKAGGAPALKALKTYARKLDEAYGKQAYRRFARADMRVLS